MAHDRLPSRSAETAVRPHGEEYAAYLADQLTAGSRAHRAEVIWMPKGNLRYRPLAALPLAERVVFRGFAHDLLTNIDEIDRVDDTRDTYQRELVDGTSFSHFAIADVASFYRYVSHELLGRRLVETTGRADLAAAAVTFLEEAMGSRAGLPQNVGASEAFAELVISPIERRLRRRGVAVSRYNDDFRIAGTSHREVRRALELLQEELHAVGFMLNESKTAILLRDTYIERLDDDEYVPADSLTDPGVGLVSETHTSLLEALAAEHPSRSREREHEATRAVRRALARLRVWEDDLAVQHGQEIINRHPALAQTYGRYCASLVKADKADVVADYLETAFPKFILTAWQELWLLEPFVAGARPGPATRAWIINLVESDAPALLKSRAALAAARATILDSQTALYVADSVPEAARADAILAFSLVSGKDPKKRSELSGLHDPKLARLIYDTQA